MKKKYNIDKIEYNFIQKGIVINGWIIIDKDDEELFVYTDNCHEKVELNISRPDVYKHYKDYLKGNEKCCGFSKNIKMDIENLKDIDIRLVKNKEEKILEKINLNKSKLLKNNTIVYNIEEVEKIKDNVKIRGWVFSKTEEKVNIFCDKKYDIKFYPRPDVFTEIKECKNSKDVGFEITLKKTFGKVTLNFSDDFSSMTEKINITKKRLRKLCLIVENFNFKNIKKSIVYIKNNGLRSFFHVVKSKIRNQRIIEDVFYDKWIKKQELTPEEIEKQKNHKFDYNPKISIVVPTFNTPKVFLSEMIESVINQTYGNWELCIADGASKNDETIDLLKEYENKESRIKVSYLSENYQISGNTNEAIKLVTGDYIALFDHDDLITKNALYEIVKSINENNIPDFIYTDEDKVDEKTSKYFNPYFKPDYSIHTLRSNNYICHFSVFKKELFDKIGEFRSEYDGAQDYDIILRMIEKANKVVHIPKILYHWRVHKDSTAGSFASKSYTIEAGRKAVEAHIKRLNIKAKVLDGFSANFYKVEYDLLSTPLVSIIIANKDHKEDLEKCLNSIKKSTYPNYEIILVENNSTTKEIFEYYNKLKNEENNLKVVFFKEKEFNYSAINNLGVKEANGEYIVLLNNDTEVISENWIEEMLSVNQIENVGIVGAKLYYPDNTIQHAGIVVGMTEVAGHMYHGVSKNDFGDFGRLKIRRNVSAVTAAALMIKKSVFDKVGGLDEVDFKVAFNDIDLCMKVIQAGYEIVWTPFAELYHYESKTRGYENTTEKVNRFKKEINNFKRKWGLWRYDPFYNKNYDLTKTYPTLKKDI